MKTNKINFSKTSGFTLIELLIVIAVLGVLAAVVLVAINPIEQLARGRDAGRHSSVAQLAHAMQNYFTVQALPTYPLASSTWQTAIINSKEIGARVAGPANSVACGVAAGTNNDSFYCYESPAPQTSFVLWTILESTQQKVRAGNGTACVSPAVAAAIYDSSTGKEGAACIATVNALPTVGMTLY